MPLELCLPVRRVKRGSTSTGKPYCFLNLGSGVGGFVPNDLQEYFKDVQPGDLVNFDVYNFQKDADHEGGIKFIPVSFAAVQS